MYANTVSVPVPGSGAALGVARALSLTFRDRAPIVLSCSNGTWLDLWLSVRKQPAVRAWAEYLMAAAPLRANSATTRTVALRIRPLLLFSCVVAISVWHVDCGSLSCPLTRRYRDLVFARAPRDVSSVPRRMCLNQSDVRCTVYSYKKHFQPVIAVFTPR